MKILIATGIYPPDIGGPATYTHRVASELQKLGHEVVVVTFADKDVFREKVHNFPVVPVWRQQGKFRRYFEYFRQVQKMSQGVDTIYAQGPVSAGLPVALACFVNGKKFVLKVVGDVAWERCQNKKSEIQIDDLEEFQRGKHDLKTEVLRKIQTWTCRRADKIIVPSRYLKKLVGGWGIEEGKIKVIYNSFSSRVCSGVQSGTAKDSARKVILSVGRLVPWKGFSALLEVVKNLPENFILKIVGSGLEEKRLKGKSEKQGLDSRVEFLGKLPHKKLINEMCLADVFVLNSTYEGLSHVILEAMACGLPVVATNIGGNPEVIQSGQSGILVEPSNQRQIKEAVLKIVKEGDFRQKIITNAKNSLEKFSEDKMIEQTLELLKVD